MKRTLLFTSLILLVIVISALLSRWFWAQSKPPATPSPGLEIQATPAVFEDIEKAIQDEIEVQKDGIPALLLYDTRIDNIKVSEDGNWATAWMTPLDPTSGETVPTEPGLVILRRINGGWGVILPSESVWFTLFQSIPDEIVPPGDIITQLIDPAYDAAALTEPYHGYYLPWAGGETMALTQSVGHDRYTPSGNAHFSFDFAMQGYPSGMFNVHAARSGRVKQAVWVHENGNPSLANYLVIEDTSTEPTTYQLYLHFAQNSIPPALRVVGAPVAKGQFIGIADDTGISSGNHLHFMVHTNPDSYWGRSVDITFNDVSINGGRPRIPSDLFYCWDTDVCDDTDYLYVSGNFLSPDHTPPAGNIISPPHGITAQSSDLYLDGWATDDLSGLSSAQFTAKFNGIWNPIGNAFTTNTFSTLWDFCDDQVPDGPLSLALDLWDNASNHNGDLPGLRHITKNYDCPPPSPECIPSNNQIALFANSDYQGACTLMNAGVHTSPGDFGPVGINNTDSIQVGSNVYATLYNNSDLSGRGETFGANDSNLDDNRIGANSTESLIVQSRDQEPDQPTPTWPDEGATYKDDASLSLVWDDNGGATQYQARIQLGSDTIYQRAWKQNAFWHINSIPTGNYTWQVRARNAAGSGIWSSPRSLIIQDNTTNPPEVVTAPFVDDMEDTQTIWIRSPYWDRNQAINHTPGGEISWFYDTNTDNGYDTGEPNSGYLTSPRINIPTNGEYSMRFWYYYETEGQGIQWDQRWVQISIDGGGYTNLYQLSDDVSNFWLQSPEIGLGEYAGQTVQVRFYFATLDEVFNQFNGWYIDDFSVINSSPPDCHDGNDSFVDATVIDYNSSTDGVICPSGDIDYYRFQGIVGDQVGVQILAQALGSQLDSYLYMLDIDGRSVLVQNDDIVYAQQTDSWITYRLLRTGTYYLKIRSWDHPTSGDAGYYYTLRLYHDQVDPRAQFIYPKESDNIPNQPIELIVSAQDSSSRVSHVQFLWHTGDWKNSDWIILGEDWNGSDGWNYIFDASSIPDTSRISFYARVFDWAGNWIGVGSWSTIPIYFPLIYK